MTDDRTPLGRAAEAAREARNLSVREAAQLAGFSEGRWRQIVKGYQNSGDHQVPANPRRRTVIAMARAVGLNVNEALRLAGFEPVTDAGTATSDVDLAALLAQDPTLSPDARAHIVNQYRLLQQLTALEVRPPDIPPDPEPVEERSAKGSFGHPQDSPADRSRQSKGA